MSCISIWLSALRWIIIWGGSCKSVVCTYKNVKKVFVFDWVFTFDISADDSCQNIGCATDYQ